MDEATFTIVLMTAVNIENKKIVDLISLNPQSYVITFMHADYRLTFKFNNDIHNKE